jgi:hypothetical protein
VPVLQLAGPLLEATVMTEFHHSTTHIEPMISGRAAADSLQLPRYWFSNPKLRARYRIPHYRLVGLVRFRLSELIAWASQRAISTSSEETHAGF